MLRRDGGGTWRLDSSFLLARRARKLVGQRVAVTSTRNGFDVLAVNLIAALPGEAVR